jgi:hypothetical protein
MFNFIQKIKHSLQKKRENDSKNASLQHTPSPLLSSIQIYKVIDL